ncbi:MAG: UDP-N-acetylmuramate--L-alanine ligase [Candidatus Omnitrophota bacterium]|nr:UDP-N-acetylmuramate--L-alanine ligase [Candidatus Omnitrophota bacterium]
MKHIHFIGVGGIGMSALAKISIAGGDKVSGSDIRSNPLIEELCERGAKVYEGHASSHIPEGTEMVIVSSSIKKDNPELMAALDKGITVLPRSEFLGRMLEEAGSALTVTGTHGKTTTTALIAHILETSGWDPTVILGGEIGSIGGNAKKGAGDMVVAEVDESDGYFRNIRSHIASVTNIEREHMENYKGWDDLLNAYRSFLNNISEGGAFVFSGEDEAIKNILPAAEKVRKVSFGIKKGCDITCSGEVFDKSIEFDLIAKGSNMGRVICPLLGRHNLMNLLNASAVCLEAGAGMEDIVSGAGSFKGVKRRFEEVGKVKGVRVIEDYAHHPTEIKAVIRAAKQAAPGKVTVVFQPHRYSRTADLAEDFTRCFNEADNVILTDIYSADEEGLLNKISVKDILDRMDRGRFSVLEMLSKEDIPGAMPGLTSPGDMVLILGAGDIREIGPGIVASIGGQA